MDEMRALKNIQTIIGYKYFFPMKHRWQNIDLFMYMYLLIYIYLFIINLNIDFTEVTFRLSGNGTEIQKETQHWKVVLPYLFIYISFG